MIQKETKIKIFDNSGAKILKCFHLANYSKKKYNKMGNIVLGSVVKYKSNRKIIKKQICKTLISTSKKQFLRKNGNFIKFDENRGIILSDNNALMGTRVFGPVVKEVKKVNNVKLGSAVEIFI